MTENYRVVIIRSEGKGDKEIAKIIDSFIKAIESKTGEVRVAYQGHDSKVIATIDSLLSMKKLAGEP
jgi:hypothetical protein